MTRPAIMVMLLLVVLGLFAGCDNKPQQAGDILTISVEPRVVPFEGTLGRAVVIPEDNLVHFLVSLQGLERQPYTLALATVPTGGVTFGPGNLWLYTGKLIESTTIRPTNGRISIWTIQPLRIVEGAKEARVVLYQLDKDGKQLTPIASTLPFTFKTVQTGH